MSFCFVVTLEALYCVFPGVIEGDVMEIDISRGEGY